MNAVEFIKAKGLDSARKHYLDIREAVNQVPRKHSLEDFSIELKRLVESHDLVESYGGLDAARKEAHKNCFDFNAPLLKAIADVESCEVKND